MSFDSKNKWNISKQEVKEWNLICCGLPCCLGIAFIVLLSIGSVTKPKDDVFNEKRDEDIKNQRSSCVFESNVGLVKCEYEEWVGDTKSTIGGERCEYVAYSPECNERFQWYDPCTSSKNLERRTLGTEMMCYIKDADCTTGKARKQPFVSKAKRSGKKCIAAAINFGCLWVLSVPTMIRIWRSCNFGEQDFGVNRTVSLTGKDAEEQITDLELGQKS